MVANAVAALSEIAESHPNSNLLDLNPQTINKLLTALNECTEWGQIFILDCLANYTPRDDRESQRSGLGHTPNLAQRAQNNAYICPIQTRLIRDRFLCFFFVSGVNLRNLFLMPLLL